jgi:uncharacterized iron-regulated membrane protein
MLFWLHLVTGCVTGAVILLMSLTGVLLTYERQVLAWLDRGPARVAAPAGAARLPVEALMESVRRQRGTLSDTATLTLRSDPREPAEIRAGREGAVYVNPYNGEILKVSGNSGARTFYQKTTAWHRWLGVEGTGRATARAITGACNLCFLLLVASGGYLWLPRAWSWRTVGSIAWFRRGVKGKARDFNWHNVFGVWSLVPLFFVLLTAVPISYQWGSDLLYRVTGSEPPPAPGARGPGGQRGAGAPRVQRPQPATTSAAGVNSLWQRAENQVPGWKSITARIAFSSGEPVSFSIDTGSGGQPQKRSMLVLDPATGSVVRWETFADASVGRQLRMWSRFVHTGEYYGLAGQTVAGAASAAGMMLVWTGISLALRRLAAWKVRRAPGKPAEAEEAAAA